MANVILNKTKIFNDPIYGFISVPHELILDIIDHPYFQRLRRIKQLGLSHLVYPGALHTRYQHVIGCANLMQQAIGTLQSKGHEITEKEGQGVILAILLHDIGHGPYSHALEHSLATEVHHEELSLIFMEKLNEVFNGQLDTAIKIFKNEYPKKFLHQLVSSQLDMDRLDYLKRDSFYTGVSEGVVSNQRIIKMLDVVNDQLVIQEKGIYSIEKFIVARRLMYWQVYLHKTVVSAEYLLVNTLKRAKYLASQGEELFCSPSFRLFLYNDITKQDFEKQEVINAFSQLDDYDIMGAIKVWGNHSDKVLALLSDMIVNRKLLKIEMQNEAFTEQEVEAHRNRIVTKFGVSYKETEYFVIASNIVNNAYSSDSDKINILFKSGKVLDITEASDNLNIQALTKSVKKHFLCYPRV